MARLKIIHVIDDLGMGGAQRQLVELAAGLAGKRYEVQVVSLSTEKAHWADPLKALGIPLVQIPHSGFWSTETFRRLVRRLQAEKPAIVQTWLFTADLYGRLAARWAGIPKVVSTVRSVETDKPWHYIQADRLLKGWTDRFIVNAQAVGDLLQRRAGVNSRKVRVIYNGLDLERFDPTRSTGSARKELGLKEDQPLVGIIGRLSPVKDHATFLAAAELVRQRIP